MCTPYALLSGMKSFLTTFYLYSILFLTQICIYSILLQNCYVTLVLIDLWGIYHWLRCNKMETDREEWGKKRRLGVCIDPAALQLDFLTCALDALPTQNVGIKRPGNETQQLSLCGALAKRSDKSCDSTFKFNSQSWMTLFGEVQLALQRNGWQKCHQKDTILTTYTFLLLPE